MAAKQKTLDFAAYLRKQHRSTIDLQERFNISERTVYRYIKKIESIGFSVDKDFNNMFFIGDNECPFCKACKQFDKKE